MIKLTKSSINEREGVLLESFTQPSHLTMPHVDCAVKETKL
jgi:hypothetical protein